MAWTFPTLRTDAAGYVEGYQWGERFLYGFAMHNWLIPGLTYTRHVLTDAGTIVLPYSVVPTPTGAQITDLCADGTPSNQDASILQISVDKKVSDRFDGCYTAAGISMVEWAALINDAKLRNMANEQKLYVAQQLAANNIASTSTDATEYGKFIDSKTQYFAHTGRYPTFALVSSDYFDALIKENIVLNLFGTANLAQDAYVHGESGQIAGVAIINTGLSTAQLGAKAYISDAEALHIVVPRSINQVPAGWSIQGPYNAGEMTEGLSFSEGIQAIVDIHAASGMFYTWIHYFFGVKVIEDFVISIGLTSSTSGGTTTTP